MKAFVRSKEAHWDPLAIGIVIGVMMFAAETLGELAYVPLLAFLAIEFARHHPRRWQRAKALLGAGRSKGSR